MAIRRIVLSGTADAMRWVGRKMAGNPTMPQQEICKKACQRFGLATSNGTSANAANPPAFTAIEIYCDPDLIDPANPPTDAHIVQALRREEDR